MDSTQSDRSLSGISLPQWMKSKISDRYDLEQTAFSPPNEDDSFFFVRYPKAKSLEPASTAATASVSQKGQINYLALGEVLQNHTVPCRQFIPEAKTSSNEMLQKTDIKYGSGPVAACDSQNKQGWLVSIVSRNASKEELFSGTDDLPIIPDLEESLDLLNINKPKVPSSTYKAKPSELREMNFWSPTSM